MVFVDTHCHLNMMVKKQFDVALSSSMLQDAQPIIDEAAAAGVKQIINVGTNLIESKNSIQLAQQYHAVWATVGIHPNDATDQWRQEFKQLERWVVERKKYRIVGLGESGLDYHYPGYNLARQRDLFRAHIELALSCDLALVIHSRDAYDETLHAIEEYVRHPLRAIMHCFSYDEQFANQVSLWGLYLGLGGTITYPKNEAVRTVARTMSLEHIVLETDAPFLPPQGMRGQQNHPKYIHTIAEYLAQLRGDSLNAVAEVTTRNAQQLFGIPS